MHKIGSTWSGRLFAAGMAAEQIHGGDGGCQGQKVSSVEVGMVFPQGVPKRDFVSTTVA